ncbi:alpha-galactosidase [Candidatus Poribacteria bacterium]|nr:alpha-galactosidase [Candidatus Poribacteria bacterium]
MSHEKTFGLMSLHFEPDQSSWSIRFSEPEIMVSNMKATLTVNGEPFTWELSEEPPASAIEDVLGHAIETTFVGVVPKLDVKVTLRLRCYACPERSGTSRRNSKPLIGMSSTIENAGSQQVRLGDFVLTDGAKLDLGGSHKKVRAHIARGIAHPVVVPVVEEGDKPLHVNSNGMITLANSSTGKAFTMGFITGERHRPIVSVRYMPDTDEIEIEGIARFNGKVLSPGESVKTDELILQASDDPLLSLEAYGDLLAKTHSPKQTPAAIGWCSWYAIRLPISHSFTMDNARIVTERFRKLGMNIMLLDHGWQEGDICGDWKIDPKDFPGGLSALAKDLENLGLELGIWIAPTDIAETSQLFQNHPDWMLRDANGKPQSTWRWFWEPKPLQYQLDATQRDAYHYIVNTFRHLREAGATYFKIDFIAGCAGENLYPKDPKTVRGWTPLRQAMLAIREGAGPDAYIRYCQTPPLLSTGVADGVFATNDTLDAGASTWNTLREVFRMSAAQYYLHRLPSWEGTGVGKLYNHDACDLSVRADAGTEECRLRVMMLAFSGSSILFSDDLTRLPEERIVMMQQCIPGFPKAACPLNLFTGKMPDIWHLHCAAGFPPPPEGAGGGLEWDLLALFNFDETQRGITVSLRDIGLSSGTRCLIREFWTEQFIGEFTASFTAVVPGLAARLYSIWPSGTDRPQYVGTNLHLSQGEAELASLNWDETARKLSGTFQRAEGIRGRAYFHIPPSFQIQQASHPVYRQNGGLMAMELSFTQPRLDWELQFHEM